MTIDQKRFYDNIHQWLKNNYKKADVCDFCGGKRTRLEWALRRGEKLEKNIKNFFTLCVFCHRKYDVTDAMREKQRKRVTGTKNEGRRRQYICSLCDKKHKARGLCIYHYNKFLLDGTLKKKYGLLG